MKYINEQYCHEIKVNISMFNDNITIDAIVAVKWQQIIAELRRTGKNYYIPFATTMSYFLLVSSYYFIFLQIARECLAYYLYYVSYTSYATDFNYWMITVVVGTIVYRCTMGIIWAIHYNCNEWCYVSSMGRVIHYIIGWIPIGCRMYIFMVAYPIDLSGGSAKVAFYSDVSYTVLELATWLIFIVAIDRAATNLALSIQSKRAIKYRRTIFNNIDQEVTGIENVEYAPGLVRLNYPSQNGDDDSTEV